MGCWLTFPNILLLCMDLVTSAEKESNFILIKDYNNFLSNPLEQHALMNHS